MHEIGITKELVDRLQMLFEDKAEIDSVSRIFITLGTGTAIPEDVLRHWFAHFSEGTKLQHAELSISSVEGNAITIDSVEVGK